jgi:hypothetical protein
MDERTRGGAHSALIEWTVYGSIAQLVLTAIEHWVGELRLYAYVLGVLIATMAGVSFAMTTRLSWARSAAGGAIAGGVCAFMGVSGSMALGDPPNWLVLSLASPILGAGVGASVVATLRSDGAR